MMVGSEFPGDDNQTLKQIQFDLYGDMVSLLFTTQRQRYIDAANLMEIDTKLSLKLLQINSFDHRTLQHSHDLLAALFRFLHPHASQRLLGQSEESLQMELRQACREFFEEQIALLSTNGDFTRAVCRATAFANQPVGVAAENTLLQIIIQHAESKGLLLKTATKSKED
jgi:hypothetical protein